MTAICDYPPLISEPPAVMTASTASVIENDTGFATLKGPPFTENEQWPGPLARFEELSWTRSPGRSAFVSAPCALAGSLYHFKEIVDPAAATHVTLPVVNVVSTGPAKCVALTTAENATAAPVVFWIESEALLKTLRGGARSCVWSDPQSPDRRYCCWQV